MALAPWLYDLPFMAVPSVWKVRRVSNPGSNETKTLIGIVRFKVVNNVLTEYISLPSGATQVVFDGGADDTLEWSRENSIGDDPNNTGPGSFHTLSVSNFGAGYKRFKATYSLGNVTTYNRASADALVGVALDLGNILKPSMIGPELDPGGWCIVSWPNDDLLAGIRAKKTGGVDLPGTGQNLNTEELLVGPVIKDQNNITTYPTSPDVFRAVKYTDLTDQDPAVSAMYTNRLAKLSGYTEHTVTATITVTPTWT